MSNLYVSFGDSKVDPTYSHVDGCFLVVGGERENPCLDSPLEVPILPGTKKEIEDWAYLMGWQVSYDSNGNAVLHTGVNR